MSDPGVPPEDPAGPAGHATGSSTPVSPLGTSQTCEHPNAMHISLDCLPPILCWNCPDCGAGGSHQDCYECDGQGRVPGMVMLDERHGAGWGVVPCKRCGGTGSAISTGDAEASSAPTTEAGQE